MTDAASGSVGFPDFCLQASTNGRRQIGGLATKLAADFRAWHAFPELKTVCVKAGTTVITDAVFDIDGRHGVRLYLVEELLAEIERVLEWADSDAARAAFELTIRRTCWGVLALVVGRQQPTDVPSLRAIIELVKGCRPGLDHLRYIDRPGQPVSLTSVLQARFSGLLAMWTHCATGDVFDDLMVALARIETATDEDRVDVAIAHLGQVAAESARIRHKAELASASVLRPHFVALDAEERNSIELGSDMAALTFLYALDRELGAAAP